MGMACAVNMVKAPTSLQMSMAMNWPLVLPLTALLQVTSVFLWITAPTLRATTASRMATRRAWIAAAIVRHALRATTASKTVTRRV